MSSHFRDREMLERMHGTWLSFYWALCKKVGRQTWDIWWKELLTALVISTIGFIWVKLTDPDPYAWKNFKIVLISTLLTFGVFAVGYIVRAPWFVHCQATGIQEESSESWLLGVVGAISIAGVLAGSLFLGRYLWEIRIAPVQMNIPAPPAPQIVQNRVLPPGTIEPRDSLRRRTLKLADEYTAFFIKSQENSPPVAIPNSSEPNPSEERKKAIQTYQDYWRKIEKDHADQFQARFIGIVKEYESKGVKVGFLQNDFAQRLPQIPPIGSVWEGSYDISRFRELAYHVDARDHLIVVAP